jgi:DSBA-like thioredoxin domain
MGYPMLLEIIERKGTIVTDLQEGAVCGIDGCAPGDIGSTTKARTSVKKNLSIHIISDAICPWCWVAKRRLDRALASRAPDIVANVTWHPFELNPGMPKAGLDRRAYRSRKFGSWEHSAWTPHRRSGICHGNPTLSLGTHNFTSPHRTKRSHSAPMHIKSYEIDGRVLRTGLQTFRCGKTMIW